MKITFLFLIISLSIFGNLPEGALYVRSEGELREVCHRLKPSEPVWMVISEKGSFETEILAQMAEGGHWPELRLIHTIEEQNALPLLEREGISILHHEPRRIFLKGEALKGWVEGVLAPRLGVSGQEIPLFAEEFLTLYGKEVGIYREVLFQIGFIQI